GIQGLSGKVSGSGSLTGTFSSPEIAADITGNTIRYLNLPVDNLNGRFHYLNKTLGLSDVRLSGNLHSLGSLASLIHFEGLEGGMEYEGIINGFIDNPQVDLTVNFNNPAWRQFTFVKGKTEIHLKNKMVNLTQSYLESDSLRFDLSGMFGLDARQGSALLTLGKKNPGIKNPPLPQNTKEQALSFPLGSVSLDFNLQDVKNPILTAQGKDISIAGLSLLVPRLCGATGSLAFSGSFSGGVTNPKAMMDIHIQQPGFRGAVLDSANAHIAMKDSMITISSLELFREKNHSRLDGQILLDKTPQFYTVTGKSAVSLIFNGENLDLRYFKPFIPGNVELDGMISYHLAVNGTIKDPHPTGTLSGRNILFDAGGGVPPVKNMDVDVLLNNNVMNITTRNAVFLGKPIDLVSTLNYAPGTYGGEGKITMEGRDILSIQGTVSPESMRITSQITGADLSLAGLVIPAMKGITGTVNSTIVVSGTRKNPKLEGGLDIRNITFNPPRIDMPIKNGIVKMSFSPSRVVVDSLFVRSGNGTILVTGTIDDILQKNWSGELIGTVNNIRLKQHNLYDSIIKAANLKYSRTGDSGIINGNVDFGNSKILYDIEPKKFLGSSGAAVQGKELPEILKQTRLQVLLNGGDKFWLDDNIARVQLLPDLSVAGTLANPVIIGRVEAGEGYVLYLDRKFTIQKASLEFTSQKEMNPTLDIEAQATVASNQMSNATSYAITISVTGEMKKPKIALSSDPALDKPDILSLLTLGVTRQQIGFGAAASDTTISLQGILLNRAEVLTSLQISGYVGRQMESALGLENFSIEGNLFQSGQLLSGTRLSATKKISDKVEVSYTTSLGRLNEQGIRVVYDLTKKISLQGETVQQGKSSLDILYKKRFQ
ncbi:MAG: translocation/assembly module TamB domain-containing protein, partial [Candidatus Latescibacterota bacterium]